MDDPPVTTLEAQPSESSTVRAELPAQIAIADLHALTTPRLIERATELNIRINPERTRHQIVFGLVRFYTLHGVTVLADGILELASESHAFLRWPLYSFRPGPDDIYVPSAHLRRYGLQSGQRIAGRLRPPRDREKFIALDEITAIEGQPAESWMPPKDFDALTATFPDERIILENTVTSSLSPRAMDLITPLGRGQRALIAAPPRTGKTILLRDIA